MRDEANRPYHRVFKNGVEVERRPYTDQEWDDFIQLNRTAAVEKALSSLNPEELEALIKLAKGE